MSKMKAFVFWVGVVSFLACVVVAASGGVEGADTKSAKASAQIEKGRAVYAKNCARCHGGDGLGQTTMGEMTEAPNLTDAAWQSRRGTSRMISSVTKGRGQMPAFAKKLSKQDIAAAVAYVRTLKR
jgi:cytochrome c oxidase cbb3-type subunit 3